jgi:hypothetical protein
MEKTQKFLDSTRQFRISLSRQKDFFFVRCVRQLTEFCVCVCPIHRSPLTIQRVIIQVEKLSHLNPPKEVVVPPYLLRKLSGHQKCSLSLFFFLMPVLSNLNRGVEGKMHRSGHPRYDITSFIFFFKIIIKK